MRPVSLWSHSDDGGGGVWSRSGDSGISCEMVVGSNITTYSEFPLAALKDIKKEYLCFRGPYQPTLLTAPPLFLISIDL